jgi:hypothetical protein
MRIILGTLLALLTLCPVLASAQSPPPAPVAPPPVSATPPPTPPNPVAPTTGTFPGLGWSLGAALPQGQMIRQTLTVPGQFIRDVWIPPQPVVVDAMVAMPAREGQADTSDKTEEPEYGVLRQTYMVPGYYVRETTVGFHYPERWVLDQSYTWRVAPAEFWPRSTVYNPGWPPPPASVGTLGSRGAPPAPMVVPSLR